jgi:hypothetical protein
MKQNITISLDQDILRKARVLAAHSGTSLSGLLAAELTRIVTQTERYERAKAQALHDLDHGLRLGGQPAARDTLYD